MTVREITEADYPAVQALHRGVGWPQRSLAGWRWLGDNPARHEIGAPAGWVVDGPDGQPVAHLGNMIHRFHLDGRPLYGATGFSIIVTPEAKGTSRALIKTFLGQTGIFAAYTLNANSRSQPLYAHHGMVPWPQATHALKLSWRVAPLTLLAGRALRGLLNVAPGLAPSMGEWFLNDRLGRTPRLRLPNGVSILTSLREGSPYDRFRKALEREGRLMGDRSPETLRRRLADPDLTTAPLILAHRRGDVITGYALAMMAKASIIEAPVLEIIDLEALAWDDEAIPALMSGLIAAARPMGAAKVRLQATTPRLQTRLGAHASTAVTEGGWGHCHAQFMMDVPYDLWSPTPYDGDYAACLRPLPLVAGKVSRARVGTGRSEASKV